MKKFLNEFKAFALKGNVMNLAVGVIIGAAFQNVINSLTSNILSPIIGLFTGQNFDSLEVGVLGVSIKYGAFITSVVNFFIMALVVFLLIKTMNTLLSLNKKDDALATATTQKCPYCVSEIDINATRCPHCTSNLEKKPPQDEGAGTTVVKG